MIEDELRSVAWYLPIGFDTAKNTAFRACDEIAQLRARAAEADALRADNEILKREMNKTINELIEARDTVAAQAQTIETARDAIDKLVMRIKKFVDDNELDLWDAETLPEIISARAWLAANAPTPTTGETEYINAFAAIDKVMTEHPELFANDGAQSETESDIAQRLQDAVDKHADEIARIE